MSLLLDRLVDRELARLHVSGGCGCAACSGRDAPARRAFIVDEAAAPARSATRGGTGGRVMPDWLGWTTPVTLGQIQQAQRDQRAGRPVPLNLRPFLATGDANVYRITRAGIDRDRPLTIGMVQETRSIAQRVGEHRSSARGDPAVRQAIANLGPNQVLVQAGQLRGHPDIRQTHGYEIWLQRREVPRIYEPDTRTFDESTL